MKFVTVIVSILFLSCPAIAQDPNAITAVFDQNWLKTLVSIEICKDPNKPGPRGTGFLVNTPNKHIALVTAKHVVFANQVTRALSFVAPMTNKPAVTGLSWLLLSHEKRLI